MSPPFLQSCPPSNQCLTDTSLVFSPFFSLSLFALPTAFLILWNVLFGWIFFFFFLQDGIEDSQMFYILQMACDHNCTAEGSCWDLLIGSTVCYEIKPHCACVVLPVTVVGWFCLVYLWCCCFTSAFFCTWDV